MDLGRGFLKLQEDNNSRRSSSLFRHKPLELNESGLHYVTRINCGCGQCVPFRVKVERDDGGLRIGKLTLATNCQTVIIIFGFFFLIAGSVLTALAYKEPILDPDLPPHARASTEQVDNPSRQQGKVAGPIFIIVGSGLVLMGFTLTALACKLNREAKRQLQLSRFTWETPPPQTPDIFNNSTGLNSHHSVNGSVIGPDHYATYSTNNLDTFSIRSRDISTPGSMGSLTQPGRRDSSFTYHRQQQHPPPPLSTIAQAVPVGIFLFGGGNTSIDSQPTAATSPRSPTIQVTDPSGFQEIELGSPTTESAPTSAPAFCTDSVTQQPFYNYNNIAVKKQRSQSQSDGTGFESFASDSQGGSGEPRRTLGEDPIGQQNKVNLGLRPSLPIIPMFATSPHYFSRVVTPLDARSLYVTSRSDEPFGSIVSLSTSGDIACFPLTSLASNPSMQPTPECDEEVSTTSSCSVATTSTPNLTAANKNANSEMNEHIISEELRKNNASADVTNNTTTSPSLSARNNIGGMISELPPINVNEGYEQSGKGNPGGASAAPAVNEAVVEFRPKPILSKREDWPKGGNTSNSMR